jgi:hypothetical protein
MTGFTRESARKSGSGFSLTVGFDVSVATADPASRPPIPAADTPSSTAPARGTSRLTYWALAIAGTPAQTAAASSPAMGGLISAPL